tara:strand:+ start:279 stop:1133 length:855 start_codon:yes stop_codon:yes gene_type:complete
MRNQSEKVSVFGATGFIGRRYCKTFPNSVIEIPRESNTAASSKVLYFISTTTNYNIFDNPFLDIETNLIKLISVLEENKNKPNLEFNFISSWFVYGKQEKLPAKETSPCNPRGFYSITKRAAEQLLVSYCETYKINYRILRLCNVIGETDSSASPKKNALQHMIGRLKTNEPVYLYDDGSHIRDYMYVDDVCHALSLCIKKSSINKIVNIGSGNPVTIKELIGYCKDYLGSQSVITSIAPPRFHEIVQTKDMFLDITELNRIGFEEKFVSSKGLKIIMENLNEE